MVLTGAAALHGATVAQPYARIVNAAAHARLGNSAVPSPLSSATVAATGAFPYNP